MSMAKDNLENIVKKMEGNKKVEAMFVTDVAGKKVEWEMTFQFNLDNEDPFNLTIKGPKASISDGVATDAAILMTGNNNSIVKICNGQGDF